MVQISLPSFVANAKIIVKELRLLANQKHIDSAEVEVIIERKSSKTVVSRVHSSVKLMGI